MFSKKLEKKVAELELKINLPPKMNHPERLDSMLLPALGYVQSDYTTIEEIVKKLYNEIYIKQSHSDSISITRITLKEYLLQQLAIRDKTIDSLYNEILKLKEIVREVTDHVYSKDTAE